MKRIFQALTTVVFSLAVMTAVHGATFVVNTTNDTLDVTPGDTNCADAGGMCSLRAAISEANALGGADIITLPAGAYTQTLVAANDDANAGGDWDVTSQLTINGAGEATTFIQANASPGLATERVINVRAGGDLTLTGLTVRNGRFTGTMTVATRGAGIENLAVLTLTNVTVRDNQVNSTSGNSIAAGIQNGGTALTLTNSTVTANSNVRSVGGAAFGGGVASITPSTIVINNSSISGNSVTGTTFGFGAGLYLESTFNVTATNSNFNNNTGTGAGASGSNGSGVRALSNVGAAVFNATNCSFSGNTGTGGTANQGVGLQFFTVTAAAATITATLDRTVVNGNTGNLVGVGVAAQVNGGNFTLNVLNSTISNNTGATNGGGMLITNTGGTANSTATVNVTNSTVSGNIANGNGGGVALEQPALGAISMNLNFATIANNRANNDNVGVESGGGVIRAGGTLNFKNSIVADNTLGSTGTAPDISGTVNSQDYNHIENATGATIGGITTNNVTGTDPGLGALGANGGPTQTHLPGTGSPVLNSIPSGTNDCGTTVTTEQRGLVTRAAGAGCEKGSVEVAAAVPATIAGRVTTADGRGIRNIIVTLSGGGLPSPLIFQTGPLGGYFFTGILTGQTYTLSVDGKRFTFTPNSRPITLTGDALGENWVAEPGQILRPSDPPER